MHTLATLFGNTLPKINFSKTMAFATFLAGTEVYHDIGFINLIYALVTGETCLVVHTFKFL